jgi:hypothetical protein
MEFPYTIPIIKGQALVKGSRVIELTEKVFLRGHILGFNLSVNGAKIIKIFE